MNPHALAKLSPSALMDFLCHALGSNDLPSVRDGFAQFQSRFERKCTTPDGSRQFLDDFVLLAGRPEFRKHHISDPAARHVAQLEHLLELASLRASSSNKETVLRQIVDSRERGWDLIQALTAAPEHGLSSADLAQRLSISAQNLTPLVTVFEAQGLLDRTKRGRFVFVTLTPQSRKLTSTETEASQSFAAESARPLFTTRFIPGRGVFGKAAA